MERLIFKNLTAALLLMLYLFTLWGCEDGEITVPKKADKKEATTNLKSKISFDSETIDVVEGKYINVSLTLDKAATEDFFLKLSFSTAEIASAINDDDYKQEVAYSADGTQWTLESDKTRVKFKNNTTSLRIRIPTIDDSKLEVGKEAMDINFAIDGKNTEIGFATNTVRVVLQDNEEVNRKLTGGAFMTFDISDYDNPKVSGARNYANNELEKKIVDGDWKPILQDVAKLLKLRPDIKVTEFQLVLEVIVQPGGFVSPNFSTSDEEDWIWGMNGESAYTKVTANATEAQSYNEDGVFGYVLTHEFGHLLTLNSKEIVPKGSNSGNCKHYSNQEGCSKENSHINQFYLNFYKNSPNLKKPVNVSEYASTKLEEDLAETFAQYVVQEKLPEISENSSGALRKLHFLLGRQGMAELRTAIRGLIKLDYPRHNPKGQKDINARRIAQAPFSIYNVDKNGKPVSCLDR